MIKTDKLTIDLPGFSVREIDLQIGRGEFFALIGPTGSGKTLILEALAGLTKVSRGRVYLAGEDVTDLPPERRRIGIVYQDNALFPHLNVIKNITYGLRYAPDQTGGDLEEMLDTLGLTRLRERNVTTLSGGEAQRVALARALIVNPQVLLLDEPLSALDPAFRHDLQVMLKKLHQQRGLTCLMVSHDFGEVISLAERAAVLNQGRLEQTGSVRDIFHAPASPFVARFVGMKNVFPARFTGSRAQVGELVLGLSQSSETGQTEGHVAIRPDKLRIELNGDGPDGGNRFTGRVRGLVDLGPIWEAHVQVGDLDFCCLLGADQADGLGGRIGDEVCLAVEPQDIHTI